MPKGEPFNYVICNPACLINERKYEYKDSLGSIVVDRTDFIALLRTLTIREETGRSVFLLRLIKSMSLIQLLTLCIFDTTLKVVLLFRMKSIRSH